MVNSKKRRVDAAESCARTAAAQVSAGEARTKSKSCDERLNEILTVIGANNFSLYSFLCKCIESKDDMVRIKMEYFYRHNGPAKVLRALKNNMTWPDYTADTVDAALDFVMQEASEELKKLATLERHSLKLPSEKITAQMVSTFSFARLTKTYEQWAPLLSKLVNSLATLNDTSTREPRIIVPTIISMLLIMRSSKSNFFQKVFSIYLYGSGTPRKVIDVLARAGLSVSYPSLMTALQSLTNDALNQTRRFVEKQPFYVVYDNINIASKKYDQRLGNQNEFQNGATATVIAASGFIETGSDPAPLQHLCLKDLLPTAANNLHRRKAFAFHLLDVLSRHYNNYKHCRSPEPTVRILEPVKTVAFPLPSMKIDQSTVEGNKDIIDAIMKSTLQLTMEWFDGRRIIFAGDQFSVARLRTLKEHRWDDVSTYERMEWVVPIFQLFHLQMLWGATILRHYYGDVSAPGSIAYNASMLGRKNVLPENPDFHATDELLRHTFDAMTLIAWQEVLGMADLEGFARKRNKHSLSESTKTAVDQLMDLYLDPNNVHKLNGPASKNAALFLRDMLFYLELSAAIKTGDVGRIEEVIKWLTIIFQAGCTKKYANELLHLHCGLSYSWTARTKDIILSSWLVNTTGQPNGWIPADLYQEHNNRLTKTIYAAKESNGIWDTSAQSMSTNIRTFQHIKSNMEKEYQIQYGGSRHSSVSAAADIQTIMRSIKENGILSKVPHDHNSRKLEAIKLVKNLFTEGMVKLTDEERIQGFKDYFINRSSFSCQETEPDQNEPDQEPVFEIERYLDSISEE